MLFTDTQIISNSRSSGRNSEGTMEAIKTLALTERAIVRRITAVLVAGATKLAQKFRRNRA